MADNDITQSPSTESRALSPEQTLTIPSLPPRIRSSVRNRRQLLQRFYDLHFGSRSNVHRTAVYEALETNNPERTATIAAVNTLCIAQIATSFEDESLKADAKSLYRRAMSCVNRQMHLPFGRRPTQAQLDDIAGAIYALITSALFTSVEAGRLDWMNHIEGVLKIIQAYGWQSLSPRLASALFYDYKYNAFFNNLLRRSKASLRERPLEMSAADSSTAFLNNHALDVTGLIWRSDRIVQVGLSQDETSNPLAAHVVMRLLTELNAYISRLKRWHLQWIKDSQMHPRPFFRLVTTTTFVHFRSLCGPHFGVFPMAYEFTQAQHEKDFRVLCICLLNLNQAIMDVHHAFQEFCDSTQLQLQLRSAEYDAETCAADLCMLIPGCTRPEYKTAAGIRGLQRLHYAARFYERSGRCLQWAWCRHVSASLSESYGINIEFPA